MLAVKDKELIYATPHAVKTLHLPHASAWGAVGRFLGAKVSGGGGGELWVDLDGFDAGGVKRVVAAAEKGLATPA